MSTERYLFLIKGSLVLAQPLAARLMAKARLKLVGRMAGSVRITRL